MANKQIQQSSITKPKIIGAALVLFIAVAFVLKDYVPGWIAAVKSGWRGQDAISERSLNAVELAEWIKYMGGFAQDMKEALKEPLRVSAASASRPAPGAATNQVTFITGVFAESPSRTYLEKDEVLVSVKFSGPVRVATNDPAASPRLLLETGAFDRYAEYVGQGSDSNILKFKYVVQAGDTARNLDYVKGDALHGDEAIKSHAGQPVDDHLPMPGAAGSLGASANIEIRAEPPEPPRFVGVVRSEKSEWTALSPAGLTWGCGETINGPKGEEFIILRITDNEIWCMLAADESEIALPDIDAIRRYPVGIKIAGLKKSAERGAEFQYNGFVFHIEDIADDYFRVYARKSNLPLIHLICFVF